MSDAPIASQRQADLRHRPQIEFGFGRERRSLLDTAAFPEGTRRESCRRSARMSTGRTFLLSV